MGGPCSGGLQHHAKGEYHPDFCAAIGERVHGPMALPEHNPDPSPVSRRGRARRGPATTPRKGER
jgi:hypothetical protein